MNLILKIVSGLIALILTLFLWVKMTGMDNGLSENFPETEDPDDDAEQQKLLLVDGYKAIVLDEQTIAASGLAFAQLNSLSFKKEFIAYAEIIDIEALVTLKTEYQVLFAERKVLQNNLHNHDKIVEHAEALHKAKSLSTRELKKAHADRDLIASELKAMNTRLSGFTYKLQSKWGDEISSFLLDYDKQALFDSLASHQKLLLLVSLPKGKEFNPASQNVYVGHTGRRDSAVPVIHVDIAKHVNNPLYGESYIYLLDTNKLRTGMRLFAWIEEENQSIDGMFIPDSAVIWYANEPWIYLKQQDSLFVRRPLNRAIKIDNGWLLEEQTLTGVSIVVTGGQILLSEEFKWAIPDENDD